MKKVIKTDEQWRELLDHKQFMVTRRKLTEPPYSSEFALSEKAGLYSCTCCGEPLFDSSCKLDIKTGWPSFFIPANPDAVREEIDETHPEQGIAVICNCCDAHLGHLFEDGPEPSGLRYSVNSLALSFAERETNPAQQPQAVDAAQTAEPAGWQPSEPTNKDGDCGGGSCGCN